MKYLVIIVVALLAIVVSVPVTVWIANMIGPVVFPFPEWRHDDSCVILAWVILQLLSVGLIIVFSILAARRARRASTVDL